MVSRTQIARSIMFRESGIKSAVAFFNISFSISICCRFFFSSRISICARAIGETFGVLLSVAIAGTKNISTRVSSEAADIFLFQSLTLHYNLRTYR
ncbi:predicted protein [Escherichia albertii]|nr:predicted protein [Escherichia albertii]